MSEVLSSHNRRIMRFMDGGGHTSFGWDAEDDEWVLPMIRQKLREGYVFWIVRRPQPERRLQEVRLERVEDIGDTRHVIIRDVAARRLFEQGHIGLVADTDEEITTERASRTAEEIVANDTVAHRQFGRG